MCFQIVAHILNEFILFQVSLLSLHIDKMSEMGNASIGSLSSKTLSIHLYILVFIIFMITFQEAQFLLYKYGRTEIVFSSLSSVIFFHLPPTWRWFSPLKKAREISKIYMLVQNLILPDSFHISFFILYRNSSNFLMRWSLKRHLFFTFPLHVKHLWLKDK